MSRHTAEWTNCACISKWIESLTARCTCYIFLATPPLLMIIEVKATSMVAQTGNKLLFLVGNIHLYSHTALKTMANSFQPTDIRPCAVTLLKDSSMVGVENFQET